MVDAVTQQMNKHNEQKVIEVNVEQNNVSQKQVVEEQKQQTDPDKNMNNKNDEERNQEIDEILSGSKFASSSLDLINLSHSDPLLKSSGLSSDPLLNPLLNPLLSNEQGGIGAGSASVDQLGKSGDKNVLERNDDGSLVGMEVKGSDDVVVPIGWKEIGFLFSGTFYINDRLCVMTPSFMKIST